MDNKTKKNTSVCSCSACCSHSDAENSKEDLKKIILSSLFFVIALAVRNVSFFKQGIFLSENSFLIKLIPDIGIVLYFAAYIICGREVIKSAIENIIHGSVFDENFLMTVATLGAVAIGQYPEAVAVMILSRIGEYFEDFALGESRQSVEKLIEIRPDKAWVLKNGIEKQVKPEDVCIDDVILVKPGERVPLDGVVVKGETFVDTSSLTGEPVPRKIHKNSLVLSGSINTESVIEIKVTKLYEDSAIVRILDLVENAENRKAKSEQFITRFARYYTPVVCLAALILGVIPPLIFNQPWNTWIYRGLTFLVVSCPCAFVISIPLSFFGGIGAASKNGILIKGSNFIETLASVKTAVFDKTGTITRGVFKVSAIHPSDAVNVSEDELLAIAAHAEKYSNHPISKSLRTAHYGECCNNCHIETTEEISGQGIKVLLNGQIILAGNLTLMQNMRVKDFQSCKKDDNGTIVHIAVDGIYYGHIIISDEIKTDAEQSVTALKLLGIKKTVMLTGDSKENAEAVANSVGIDTAYSNLLPEDKLQKIEKIIEEKQPKTAVLYVGDGINDAPVLARSDVGIAMGGLGTDSAIEAADVIIMTDEVKRITDSIKIAKRTMGIVWQNIIFAFAVKIIVLVLSAFGNVTMWAAVFADVGVTILAVLNAMRQLPKKY